MATQRKVLTVKEASEELGISVNLAYRQVRNGTIFSVKLGDRYLIPRRTFEQLLSGLPQTPADGREGGLAETPPPEREVR